jgi:hypothetical protein
MKELALKQRIFLVVSNPMHKYICQECLPNKSLDKIEKDNEGLFVLTFAELLEVDETLLKDSIVVIDEAHMYLGQQGALDKLHAPARVIAMTATPGSERSKHQLKLHLKCDILEPINDDNTF